MDCPAFFEAAAAALGEAAVEPTRTTPGDQCVLEFFHPRTVAALGNDGLAARFNRSGLVWAPRGRLLAARLRVPERHGDAVAAALADAPLAFERTDHRGVSGSDGEVVTVLHFGTRASDVSRGALESTLAAVGAALAV